MHGDTLSGTVVRRRALRRAALPLGLAVGAAGGAVLLANRSPYVPFSYGICPSVLLLGVSCPGCGGLRATHDLVTGDLAGAWAANPLWVVAVPLLLAVWGRWFLGRLRGSPPLVVPSWLPWAVLAVVLLFGVLRNLPALAPWLGPAP